MNHSELSVWDLVIVGAYLLSMILIGVHAVKRVKNTGDYFVGNHSFGPFVLMATVCATIIGGSGLMGRAGVAYSSGFKAVITAVPYLLGMFVFSGIAGRISDVGEKFGVSSIPELFEKRFGTASKIILAALIAFTMMGTVAAQVTATATIINMLGSDIGLSYEAGALIATVVFMVYTATSGLFGVVYTDVMQFYMLLLFVYILIPVSSLIHVGGIGNFVANLDPELVKPRVDGQIVGDIVTYLVFTMAGAEMWQRCFAARDRGSAKKGMFLGTAVYGLTILLVYFMGLVAHQVVGDDILAAYGSTDAVVPALAIKVLPIGLTGLALAGLLSVIMSTADSYLLVSVQSVVSDIIHTFHPNMKDRTEVHLSRIFAVILPIGALIIALYIKNAYNILMFAWSFYAAAAGIPAFLALYWRRATNAGILAGMISGFVVCVGWKLLGEPFGLGSAIPGTAACLVAVVVVSLATAKRHPSRFLDPYTKELSAAEN
ncbi:MAG: sodium:solute symporter family protein [Candidatus Limivicinus sp.]